MDLQHYVLNDIREMERDFRRNFINTLSGFKSANLIGTVDEAGNTNLAVFNSVVHIGADPPLLGFILRPMRAPRHTFSNIKATGFYTINSINQDIFQKAHNTSAKFSDNVSEFAACGLTEMFSEKIPAPYVAESHIRIGMQFCEDHLIYANQTVLVVGQVTEVYLPGDIVGPEGHIDLEKANTVAISGLDTYLSASRIARLGYVRPEDVDKG